MSNPSVPGAPGGQTPGGFGPQGQPPHGPMPQYGAPGYQQFQGGYQPGGQPPQPPQRSGRGALLAVGAVVLVVVIAGAAFFVMRGSAPASTPAPTAEASTATAGPPGLQFPTAAPSVNRAEILAKLPVEVGDFRFDPATDDTGVYMTSGATSIVMVSAVTGGMEFWAGGLESPVASEGGKVVCGKVDGGPACVVDSPYEGVVINLNATEKLSTPDQVGTLAKAIFDEFW